MVRRLSDVQYPGSHGRGSHVPGSHGSHGSHGLGSYENRPAPLT